MLYDVEVKFITRANNPDRYITHLGGVRADGKLWILTEEEVILSMSHGNSFYIRVDNKKVRLITGIWHDHKYLKTVLDRDQPAGLLSLPELPGQSQHTSA